MAKLVDAIDAKTYLDNFLESYLFWRTILIGKEVDYYSTGRKPLGVRVPRPPLNEYGQVLELARQRCLRSIGPKGRVGSNPSLATTNYAPLV